MITPLFLSAGGGISSENGIESNFDLAFPCPLPRGKKILKANGWLACMLTVINWDVL